MEGLNSSSENGAIRPELKPESGSANLNITLSHGPNQHQVVVPSDSSFGDLKSVIAHKIGLKPETYKLLFRGKEKEDDDNLQTAGVKDSSKVLIMEDTISVQKSPEKLETIVVSRGGEAVAIIREEVDKLADQVAALQAVVDGGTEVDDKDSLYLSEMLMRQLLKLDGIEAEGEGRVQRKMEVRRVQSFVETVDILKSRNANLVSNNIGTAPVTTQWETFEAGSESVSTESTDPSSTIPSSNATPAPAFTPTPASTSASASASVTSSTNTPAPFSCPAPASASSSSPSHLPASTKVTQDWESFA